MSLGGQRGRQGLLAGQLCAEGGGLLSTRREGSLEVVDSLGGGEELRSCAGWKEGLLTWE